MARAPYILARTLRDAHAFAQGPLELKRGHYRIVTTSGTLKAARGVDLHLVPGWENRHDRFAVRGALRYTRMNVIDHAAQAEEPAEPVVLSKAVQISVVIPEEVAAFFDVPMPEDPLADLESAKATMSAIDHTPQMSANDDFAARRAAEDLAVRDAAAPLTPDDIAELEAVISEQAEEPTEKPKRRRRRCDDCGVLVDPDEVEAHAREHLEGN